jgi:hypothetical protein
MKSFYDFYTKLQKINEENEELNPKVVDSNPQTPNGDMGIDMSSPDSKPKDTPLLMDKSKEDGDDDKSNLSPPEGKINYKFINKNLKHISKYLSKFKNIDQEKGEQLEQLLGQITNLVTSFEEPSSEDQEDGEEEPEMDSNKSETPSGDLNSTAGSADGQDLSSMVGDASQSGDMGMASQQPMDASQS